MNQSANPQRIFLERVWKRLPTEGLTEREYYPVLLKVTGGYEGAFANASAILMSLVAAQAVTVSRGDDGKLRYRRAETFPEWPDNSHGTAAYNAELKRRQDAHEAEMRKVDQQRQRDFENSPQGIERRLLEQFVAQRVEDAVGPLRAEIAQLREQLQQDTEVAA